MFSIAEQFSGATILLTGATGYIGGLVLELLLRTTDVGKIYVLLRNKANSDAASRLSQLLQKSIYHKVRDQQQLVQKVVAVDGDITLPRLGLTPEVARSLQQEVHIILHCAADIRLEVDIHSALQSNYAGTKSILHLALNCKHLRAVVHTSSCFVNMNLPRSSVVQEQLYPLKFGNREVDYEELVQDLLALHPDAADVRASALGLRWAFPNNYTLSKHLAEHLVATYRQQYGMPAAIVRPSLVCATAYEPIPGYVGNWAGPIGASAALAIGFYHSLGCVSSQPLHVWDIMPADLVANAILATAAVTAAANQQKPSPASATFNSLEAQPILIVHSSSSSTYPITLMEGWNYAVEFIKVHKPKFRLSCGPLPPMIPAFQPDPLRVKKERRWTAFKVAVTCSLLRLFGLKRAAARLQNGFEALCVYGTSKTDKDLTFSAEHLLLLESQMPKEEQKCWPLAMRPGMPLPGATQSSAIPLNTPTSIQTTTSQTAEPLLPGQQPQQHAEVLTWRRYFHSQLAGVYSLLFRQKVPQIAPSHSIGCAEVEHDFVLVH